MGPCMPPDHPLWVKWKQTLDVLCGDRKNPRLRMELDVIEDEITRRLSQNPYPLPVHGRTSKGSETDTA